MNYERKQAETEADNDLDKPIHQLLSDIHEEINNSERGIDENVAHAQKRFYSLIANIAVSNKKLSNRVLILTLITVTFTAIQVLPIIWNIIKWLVHQ